jgi:plastocyanin
VTDEHPPAKQERTEAQLTEPQPAQPSQRESLLVPIVIVVGLLALIGIVLWGFSRVLLDVEPHTATATALLMAVAIVAILSFAASRKRVTNGSLLMTVVGVLGAGMLLSGIALTVGTGEGETGPEEGETIALAAPEGAAVSGFDQTQLSAPADTAFVIAFNNQDPGVPHNVVIASDDPQKTPDAETFFTGEVVSGPMQIDYPVEPLAEGEHFFYCEIHPTTMVGTLTVAPGATPGGNTDEGQVIAAQNIAFDTDTLTFPADTPSQLTFQNDDAGVLHNVSIYTDESLSEALFTGEVITGPASVVYDIPPLPQGSYYFHCDVHPNMNGTVEVAKAAGGEGGGGEGGGGEPPPTSGATSPS